MKTIYIEGGCGSCADLIRSAGFKRTYFSSDADLILFSGGSDIDPSVYGQENVASYNFKQRDAMCEQLFNENKHKKMVGICRGAQYLAAKSGATIYQDIHIHYHNANGGLHLNSLHHQAICPHENLGTIFHTAMCGEAITDKGTFHNVQTVESFRSDRFLGVQWHPEYMHYQSPATQWFVEKLKEFAS